MHGIIGLGFRMQPFILHHDNNELKPVCCEYYRVLYCTRSEVFIYAHFFPAKNWHISAQFFLQLKNLIISDKDF